jgi:hypothetical protein
VTTHHCSLCNSLLDTGGNCPTQHQHAPMFAPDPALSDAGSRLLAGLRDIHSVTFAVPAVLVLPCGSGNANIPVKATISARRGKVRIKIELPEPATGNDQTAPKRSAADVSPNEAERGI